MIKSVQKIIKVGNSGAVTIPAKDMRRHDFAVGDEVEVIIRPAKAAVQADPTLETARQVLREYKQDFQNLAER